MAKASLRRFDVQAKWSIRLSALSVVTCALVAVLLARNWSSSLQQIVYGNPIYQFVILGVSALTMLLSFFGIVLGFNSAGQRRNEKQRLSWAGFFLGTGVLSLAFILLAAFMLLRLGL